MCLFKSLNPEKENKDHNEGPLPQIKNGPLYHQFSRFHSLQLAWAGNFTMLDIEIDAWSFLFLNFETNLILKFCSPFKITIQKREGLSNFEKPVFNFSVLYPKKSGLSKKLKVSTLNIRILNYPALNYFRSVKKKNFFLSRCKVPLKWETLKLKINYILL